MKAIVPAWRASSLTNNWFNEFDQMFETLFDHQAKNQMRVACDVDETEKYFLFTFDMPGLTDDDFSIDVNDSVLKLSGEKKTDFKEDNVRSIRGRQYGSFEHRFQLPKSVNQEKIEADYTDGVLKILLPKMEQEVPKRIEVKAKKGHFLSQLLKTDESE